MRIKYQNSVCCIRCRDAKNAQNTQSTKNQLCCCAHLLQCMTFQNIYLQLNL